jgi:CubicO group peptidase (beta-lactamase class C family)
MTSSDTLLAELDGRDNVARPHERRDGRNVPVPFRSADNAAPAGSITSNVIDMANWLRFQLGEGTFEGNTIVDAAVFREMHTPHTIIRSDTSWGMLFPDSNFLNYGLCWFVVDTNGSKVVMHGGSIDGMNALMVLVPAEKLGVVVLTNVNLSHVHSLAFLREYLDVAVADSGVDWVERSLAVKKMMDDGAAAGEAEIEALRDSSNKPTLALEGYAGSYINDLHGAAAVAVEDGGLILSRGPGLEGRLVHWFGDTYRADWGADMPGSGFVEFAVSGGRAMGYTEGDLGMFSRANE